MLANQLCFGLLVFHHKKTTTNFNMVVVLIRPRCAIAMQLVLTGKKKLSYNNPHSIFSGIFVFIKRLHLFQSIYDLAIAIAVT